MTVDVDEMFISLTREELRELYRQMAGAEKKLLGLPVDTSPLIDVFVLKAQVWRLLWQRGWQPKSWRMNWASGKSF